jgi:hypothetical protein
MGNGSSTEDEEKAISEFIKPSNERTKKKEALKSGTFSTDESKFRILSFS